VELRWHNVHNSLKNISLWINDMKFILADDPAALPWSG
jgi:hypothetical protein